MNRMLFIHPAVKRGVSLAARAASWLLLLIALGNCLFLLFAGGSHSAPAAVGVLCVAFGELLLPLLLAALLLWCHCVLAAESGLFITRVLAAVAVVLGAAHAAHRIYWLIAAAPLLNAGPTCPLLVAAIVLITALFNIPYIVSAPLRVRILLVLGAVLYTAQNFVSLFLLILPPGTCSPVYLYLLTALSVLLPLLWNPLLTHLSTYAPLIISMPEEN